MKCKNLIYCILVLCMLINDLRLYAADISKAEAELTAVKFMSGHNRKTAKPLYAEPKVIKTFVKQVKNNNALYICNFDCGGFVIVPAKEIGFGNVIAYSHTGSFDYDKAPEPARRIIDTYADKISQGFKSNTVEQPGLSANKSVTVTPVEPLLGETAWDQGDPYNLLCPKIEGATTFTGCVPTAIAQIMYYYKYPQTGAGSIEYEWNDTRITADLSQSTYEWDKMTPIYDAQSSEESKLAVARLMTDIGYACNTKFGVTQSSTPNIYPPVAFTKNFSYDKSLRWLEKRFFSDEEWLDIILENIQASKPIFYCGDNAYREGHAYVCDGVDAEGRLHFNFGWGGISNGYYVADSQLFGEKAEMIGNIKPDEGGQPNLEGYLYSSFYYDGESILLNCKIMAGGARDIPVEVAYEFKNGSKSYYHTAFTGNAYLWIENISGHVSMSMKDGTYEIRPVFRIIQEGESKDTPASEYNWQYFHHIPGSQYYLTCTSVNGELTIENTMDEPTDEGRVKIDDIYYVLNDATAEATVTYRNKINPTYSGDVVIPSTVEYNGKNYTVTEIGESAFEVCRGLTSAVIPKTVKIVGYGAFSESWAKEIRFEEGSQLEIIDEYAFNAMDCLDKINLPQGLREIRQAGLRGLNARHIEIPSTVTFIGEEALDGYKCRDITLHWDSPLACGNILEQKQYHLIDAFNIHVPKGTESKYAKVKPWCDHEIDSNTPVGDCPVTVNIDGICYELYYDATVVKPADDESRAQLNAKETIEIPSTVNYNGREFTVKRIGESALECCNAASVILPPSVRKIESDNFNHYPNLKTVRFSDNSQLKIIGQNCFKDNDNLKEIKLPSGLKRIGFLAFDKASLSEIDIPESISMIDEAAFQNCGDITLRFHTAYPPYVQYDPFNPGNYPVLGGSNATIIVPKGCKRNYESYEFWKGRNIVEDNTMEPTIDIRLSSSTVTIGIPEQDGADYYDVTVSTEDGTVIDQQQVGASARKTRSASGMSCTLNLSGDNFYQFYIEAYSDAQGKLNETTGQFNNLITNGIRIENEAEKSLLYDVYTVDGIKIKHQIYKDDVKSLPKGIYILRGTNNMIKVIN